MTASRDPEAAKLEEMREALRFYADRTKYQHTGASKYYPLADDEGAVARAALGAANTPEQRS